MAFDKNKFSPVHVIAGSHAPRIFSYYNPEDLLSEILEPGYFNKQKLIMRPNSFVKVICKDAIVELVIEKNTGEVTVRDEMLRCRDPYKDMISNNKSRKKKTCKNKPQP